MPRVDYAESDDGDMGIAEVADEVALQSQVRTLTEKLNAYDKIIKRVAEREGRMWAIEARDDFGVESEDEAAGDETDGPMCTVCRTKPPLDLKLPCDCVETIICGGCIRKHYVTSYAEYPSQLAKCPFCSQSPGMSHSDYRRIRALWYIRNEDDDLEVQYNLQF